MANPATTRRGSREARIALGLSHVRYALANLRLRPGQSFFSLGGLAVGVFAFLAASGVLHGMTAAITDSLAAEGAGVFRVRRDRREAEDSGKRETSARPPIRRQELSSLSKALRDRADVSAEVWAEGNQVTRGARRTLPQVTVIGATSLAIEVNNLELGSGRALTELDVQTARRVAVIGHGIVRRLFPLGPESALGQEVELWGERFEVVGTLRRSPTELGLGQPAKNSRVLIPLTAFARFQGERSLLLSARVKDPLELETEIAATRLALRFARKLGAHVPDDFVITDNRDLAEMLGGLSALLTVMSGFISILLLVISGIGISNVLFAALYQRRSEIGVRMALGASPTAIKGQFLVESTAWALVGGLVGCGAAALCAAAATRLTVYQVQISSIEYGISLGVCAVVGFVAGILPAGRAANLMPIEAIRSR